jgi:hypothetical protein
MKYTFDFSPEKDLVLKEVRGVGFDDVIKVIKNGRIIDNINHFNKKKYPNQKIFILKFKSKIYAIPYVIDGKRKIIFLKTIYPSSSLKRKYEQKNTK